MSSRGVDTRFLPERGLPGDARLYIPNDGAWAPQFESLTAACLPVRRHRTRSVVLGGALALVLLACAGLVLGLLRPSPSTSSSPTIDTTSSAPPTAEPEAQARLLRLLPPGYPAGSCKPLAPPKDALAQVHCSENANPGGPRWATFTLVPNKTALDAAFNNLVESSATVVCPGNIQSPGPWRRNASPEQISGVLYCGIQEGRETVVWTDETKLMLSAIQTGPPGPSFPQLYAWWSSHS